MTDDFEPHRKYLIGVAYRMLGSVAEAQDAVRCGSTACPASC